MSIEDDLTPTAADHIHSAVSALFSFVPGGSELFNWLVDKPINARRDQWIIEMEKRLRYLESRGLKIDELQKNEEFISAVLYASSIAIRNHSEEKRIALLNAINNIAVHEDLDESKNRMFLNYIDTFTDWHLRILWFFENPGLRFIDSTGKIPSLHKAAISVYFNSFFSEQKLGQELLGTIIDDLYIKGLLTINNSNFTSVMPPSTPLGETPLKKRLTKLGIEFINFIKDDES